MVDKAPKPTPSPSSGPRTSTSGELVDRVSGEAKSTTPPPSGSAPKGAKYGLDGRPIQSPIYAGQVWFAPLKPGETQTRFKKTQYYKGSGMAYLQTLTNKQRVEILGKLAQIPGAYSNPKDAPTQSYLQGLASSGLVAVREEDAAAVEKLMYISDTVGEDIQDTIARFYANPKLAAQTLDMSGYIKGAKKVNLTPAAALEVELSQALLDFLDLKADKKFLNNYVETINNLEIKRGGNLTSIERQQLLFDFVQKKAIDLFKDDKSPDTMLYQRGAVGGAYNVLRKAYYDYGIPAGEKDIYKQAIDGARSRQALENALQKISVQAQVAFPALTKYFEQGLTTRESLAAYSGIYSKIYGVPESSIEISKMFPVFKGKELMSPQEWEKYLYTLPEYKKTKLYEARTFDDASAMLRNFFGGAA